MLTTDPFTAAVAAIATGAILGLLIALYREHREPFLFWAALAWAGSLLHFLAELPRELEDDGLAWAFAAALALAVKSLGFLAAGLAYRAPAAVSRWAILAGVGIALALAGMQTATLPLLAHARPALREIPLTLAQGVAVFAAGIAFWPRALPEPRKLANHVGPLALTRLLAQPLLLLLHHARGARLLALTLIAWGGLQPLFLLPLPEAVASGLLRTSGLLQAVQSVALVMLVLDRARQRAEYLRRFNQTLLDGMELGLALVGRDLRIQHANRWMTERFGGGIVGRTCLDTYAAGREQCEACPWRASPLASRQLTLQGPEAAAFLVTCSPLVAPDGSRLLLELVSDVTEQEAMRARLLHAEHMATVGEMASRVAHEVRNPLAVMEVNAELARLELGPDGNAAALAHIAIVRAEIRRVANLIESYLRLGRLPSLLPGPMHLDGMLRGRLATLDAELRQRQIAVRASFAADVPAFLADSEQLGQVFMHLFRNAIEAMPEGGTLAITTARLDGTVTIEVTDTGAGVAPDQVERIFRPFHTTKPLGAGLGLAVARDIVRAHGGTLTCRSQPGGCFVVTLPLATARSVALDDLDAVSRIPKEMVE